MLRTVIVVFFSIAITTMAIATPHLQDTLPRIEILDSLKKYGDSVFSFSILPPKKHVNTQQASIRVEIEANGITICKPLYYPFWGEPLTAAVLVKATNGITNWKIKYYYIPGLLNISATIQSNYTSPDINYTLVTGGGDLYQGKVSIVGGIKVKINNLIFQDTANITFSSSNKKESKDLSIKIDSVYWFNKAQQFVFEYDVNYLLNKNNDSLVNTANNNNFIANPLTTLQDVVVKSKIKTKAQIFEEQYVSALYKNELTGYTIDMLDNNQNGLYGDIFQYLTGRVAGLVIRRDANGNYSASFARNDNLTSGSSLGVEFLLDEMRTSITTISQLNPSDIALIKMFKGPVVFGQLGGANGVICVYTKRGESASAKKYIKSFNIRGFTGQEVIVQ